MTETDLDGKGNALFGVFDGHGGREVALYVARHIKRVLVESDKYRGGALEEAMRDCYVALDDEMIGAEGKRELHTLKAEEDPDDGSDMLANAAIMKLVREQLQARLAEGEAEGGDGEPRRITLTVDPAALLAGGEGGEDPVRPDVEMEEGGGNLIRATLEDAPPGDDADDGAAGPGEDEEDVSSAGCTAVCALVAGDKLIVANAGDSRAVLSRGGRAIALSRDHKPTDEDEHARITAAGATVSEGRVNGALNLSRALGDMEYKYKEGLAPEEQAITCVPEMKVLDLDPSDDFLLLACDGIWDVMENQEAVDFVRERLAEGKDPVAICEEMCDFCLAPDTAGTGKGCDNMTAMVVVLKKR